MISDSPYQVGGQAISARTGIIYGVLSAMIMLLFVAIVQPLSGFHYTDVLTHIGKTIIPNWIFPEMVHPQIEVGLFTHILLSTFFGVLYAVCQQRVPIRGLLFVGIYYGFLIWIVNRLFITPLLQEYLRILCRSWTWLLACLLFGLSMALVSTWVIIHQQIEDVNAIPKD